LNQETAVDIGQPNFDHPIQLVRPDGTATADLRRGQRLAAARIAAGMAHVRDAAA
jgi:hypothetical protein